MKNNTNIRLHVSKALFETIAKEVLAEAKKANMSGGAYTETVKMPKQATKIKEVNAEADADKMKKMEEMSSKEKMAKGLYKEEGMDEATDISNHYDFEYRKIDGDCYKIDPETKEKSKVHHSYCKRSQTEMQVNVAEEGEVEEAFDPQAVTDILSVLAGMGGIALGGLGIAKWQDKIKAKNPELYKKLQSISSSIEKADPSKKLSEKSVSLNELRKQAKNK